MQLTFGDAEDVGLRKQTRRELFLAEMEQVVPWQALLALMEPHYPKLGRAGRTSVGDWTRTIWPARSCPRSTHTCAQRDAFAQRDDRGCHDHCHTKLDQGYPPFLAFAKSGAKQPMPISALG